MASLQGVVKLQKNQSGQHLQELWDQVYRKGAKGDILRDILMFYISHKVFSPPPQKFYDTLLLSFSAKGTSRKTKNVIFQILEEIGPSIERSIMETVRLSPSHATTIELLSCVLCSGLIPVLDEATLSTLFVLLGNESLSNEEAGKLLVFLHQVVLSDSRSALMKDESIVRLGEMMAAWLSLRSKQGDVGTVLTLADNYTKSQVLGVYSFTLLHSWLTSVEQRLMSDGVRGLLLGCVREYCNSAVRLSMQPTKLEQDKALQKAVLCEVVDILYRLVQLDGSQHLQSLLIVKRIQKTVRDNFRLDSRDIAIFVRILKFLLTYGEKSESPLPFCEYVLGDIVLRSYSSDLAAFDIAVFLTNHAASLDPTLLERFFPNLLKLVACHPSSLVEEFIILVPLFITTRTVVEVFHSLLDLPLLSATLSLHLASARLAPGVHQAPALLALSERVGTAALRPSLNHLMRSQATGALPESLPSRGYVKAMQALSSHPLVDTCAQIVPILLEAFFRQLATLDSESTARVLGTALTKLRVFQGHSAAVYNVLATNLPAMIERDPALVWTVQSQMTEYVSILDNNITCPTLYSQLVTCVGDLASTSPTAAAKLTYYETLECVVYEMLAQITAGEEISLELLITICTTLAKLTGRSQELTPRLLLCFSKVQRHLVSTQVPAECSQEERRAAHDRIQQLIGVINNADAVSPSVVKSCSTEGDPTLASLLQVLAKLTEDR